MGLRYVSIQNYPICDMQNLRFCPCTFILECFVSWYPHCVRTLNAWNVGQLNTIHSRIIPWTSLKWSWTCFVLHTLLTYICILQNSANFVKYDLPLLIRNNSSISTCRKMHKSFLLEEFLNNYPTLSGHS